MSTFDFIATSGTIEMKFHPKDPTNTGEALEVAGTDTGLNGSETQYKDPYVYELIQATDTFSPNFRFDDTESLLWGYDDIEADVQDLHIMFSDVVSKAPVKFNTTTYSEALAGEELTETQEYFNIGE